MFNLLSLFQAAPVVCANYDLACQIEQGDYTGAAMTAASVALAVGSTLYFYWNRPDVVSITDPDWNSSDRISITAPVVEAAPAVKEIKEGRRVTAAKVAATEEAIRKAKEPVASEYSRTAKPGRIR